MGKIFYLMGKSSTGKDTIYSRLMEDEALRLCPVVMYTTRPIRAGEKEGVAYHFTDEAGLNAIRESGRLIELRAYDTCMGVWYYFTADDGQINLEENDYLIIGTLESYNKSKVYFGTEHLVPIYVELEDGERLQRALDRERLQEPPKYDELCRRFLADSEDFAEEKIKEAGIDRRFENNDLETCLQEIRAYVNSQTKRG
ncbi:MAG: guanylate kinase [Clostridiales bacterium]|mgnify:CR=1 FL=1|nr:guanylate kinase [Clostridiales bacterium]